MSEKFKVTEKNISGRYYVDESCIYCELCVKTAPANFSFDSEKAEAYVSSQPSNEQERTLMAEVIELCPSTSIHDSGSTWKADFGLSKSVTPTSIGGSILQIISSWFNKK